jgi:hypothetical protein
MIGRTDQISPFAGDAIASGSKAVPSTKSNTTSASSPSNAAMQSITKKKVPMPFEYYKAPTVIEPDLATYHATDWLPGGMLSSTTDLEF